MYVILFAFAFLFNSAYSLRWMDGFADERLGRQFKVTPQTEDVYVYQNNGPTFDNA